MILFPSRMWLLVVLVFLFFAAGLSVVYAEEAVLKVDQLPMESTAEYQVVESVAYPVTGKIQVGLSAVSLSGEPFYSTRGALIEATYNWRENLGVTLGYARLHSFADSDAKKIIDQNPWEGDAFAPNQVIRAGLKWTPFYGKFIFTSDNSGIQRVRLSAIAGLTVLNNKRYYGWIRPISPEQTAIGPWLGAELAFPFARWVAAKFQTDLMLARKMNLYSEGYRHFEQLRPFRANWMFNLGVVFSI